MFEKLSTVKDFIVFLKKRRLFWLIPMVMVILVFGALILIIGSSPLAPIVYPLF